MRDLCVVSCDQEDVGSQRCRMAAPDLQSIGVPIGGCVKVHTGTQTALCTAWPRNDGHRELIQYSAIVSKSSLDRNAVSLQTVKYHDIEVVVSSRVDSVCVTAVITDHVKVGKLKKNIRKENSELHTNVKTLLRKLYVANDYTVNYKKCRLGKMYGISRVVVHSIFSEDKCGLVHSGTEIVIKDVTSEARFEQKNQRQTYRVGGLERQFQQLKDIVSFPFQHPYIGEPSGISWPQSVLLRGPPGCGKTTLVKALAVDLDAYLLTINGPELLGSRPGESESNLRSSFEKAAYVSQEGPCILFLDEVDAICAKRGKGVGLPERRVVSQLLSLLDSLQQNPGLVVIAATNRPHVLDAAVRRPGRLDKEVG